MIRWHSIYLHGILVWVEQTRTRAREMVKKSGRNCQVKDVENGQITGERLVISKWLLDIQRECERLELHSITVRAMELNMIVSDLKKHCYWSDIELALTSVHRAFIGDLDWVVFVRIPQNKAKYFECDNEDALFGQKVYKHFVSARTDIKNSGNCIAGDLHDAAVFHLMRVVEIGLRELARNLKIKQKKTPLDYAGWKWVVDKIDEKLSAKMPKARGQKQAAALKFKHDLLADFKAFEVLRNEIMHGRSHHNEHEAIGLFNRVRDFMQRLAEQTSK